MLWRLTRADFESRKGTGNKRAMKKIVTAGEIPGLLAYAGDEPVGWCAIAPRDTYPALDRSRVMARVDDNPVWSMACLFIARPYRRRGVSVVLLKAAVRHAKKHRARIVEGYPHVPKKDRAPDAFIWTGTDSAFRKVGFREVARRSPTRPIMRKMISSASG